MRKFPINPNSILTKGICVLYMYSLQGTEVTVQQQLHLQSCDDVPEYQNDNLLNLYPDRADYPQIHAALIFDFPEPFSMS